MTAEHIDYAALQAAMNPAKENTMMSTADEVRETLPELEPCPQPGCVAEGHHFHYKREDNGTGVAHSSWSDRSDYCGELEFVTACYTTRRPDEEALTTTTDLQTIDCRGIDPSRVQSVIDALADVITTARADR